MTALLELETEPGVYRSDDGWRVVPQIHGPTWRRNPEWDGFDPLTEFILPDITLGWEILAWIRSNLLDDEGAPFKPTREQARFILWWYAIDVRGRFVYREGIFQRLKGHGKDPLAAALAAVEFVGPCRFAGWAKIDMPDKGLRRGDPVAKPNPKAWIQVAAVSKDQPLALDQRVRTPAGWKTVGDLSIGDFVYDEKGRAQKIRRQTEVMEGLDCYRLTFDDGQSVVASAEHGWTVDRKRLRGDHHVRETLTTAQLAEGYLDSKGGRRVRIPTAGVDSPDVDLPIDPYLLGLWLGDGTHTNGIIAIDWRQRNELEKILSPLLGDNEMLRFTHVHENTGFLNIRNTSRHAANGPAFIQRLRRIGVLGNKHIPDLYSFSGTGQRRNLLQGLIDSDGCVLPDGQVRFTNTNRVLIEGVRDLVASLGYKAHVRNPSPGTWIVGFRPDDQPVARLSYKARRQRPRIKPQALHRYLEHVEKVESVPVKCIGIDTPSHLFQVESGILTHNTVNTMAIFPSLFTKECLSEHGIDLGKEIIYAYHGARRIQAVTSSPRALEGGRPTFVIMNETHHWLQNNEGHGMAKVIERNVVKAKGGAARTLAITNAYEPHEDSHAQRVREAWADEAAGLTIDTGVLYDSLEAPPDARLRPPKQHKDDPEPTDDEVKAYLGAIVSAVRGDSTWLDVENIVSAILSKKNPPSESRRFYFNQVVAAEDAWLDPVAVDAALDILAAEYRRTTEHDTLRAGWDVVHPDEEVVAFFDGSKSDDSTAIVGCRLSDGYVFTIGVWQKPRGERGKTWLVPRASVDARVREMFERFNVVAFWGDPSHALDDEDSSRYWDGMMDDWHRRYKDELQVWPTKSGHRKHSVMFDMTSPERQSLFVSAAEQFVEEMEHLNDIEEYAPTFTHDGHPALVQHMKNAKKAPGRFGTSLMKEHRESANKIDLAVCAVGARMVRRLMLNEGVEEETPAAGTVWGVGF